MPRDDSFHEVDARIAARLEHDRGTMISGSALVIDRTRVSRRVLEPISAATAAMTHAKLTAAAGVDGH